MKLPKSLTTSTTLIKTLAPLLFVALTLFAYYLGTQNQDKKLLHSKDVQVQQLKKQLGEKEEEVQLAIENRGKVQKTYTSTYDFNDFGIYSPLFENKQVQNTVYLYKRNTIAQKSIVVVEDKEKSSEIKASVWEFVNSNISPSGPQKDYVTFDGYENYGLHPNYLTDIMEKWKESYTNENGIKMYWSYSNRPRGDVVHAVDIEFYQGHTPNGNPILVKLSINNLYALDPNDQALNPTKEKIKQLADTVSERRY